MSVLIKLGSVDPTVIQWQQFLKGQFPESEIVASGNFDGVTDSVTKRFQQLHRLTPDGVVGSKTLQLALSLGLCVTDQPTTNGILPITAAQREILFGHFNYTPAPVANNPEAIKIDQSWINSNITSVTIDELANISGAPKNCTIPFNHAAASQLKSLFGAWSSAGLLDRILTWDGSWAPRFIRGSRTTLSNHAWGTAFDINARWNPLGTVPPAIGDKGCTRELVSIAEDNGFFWGGNFSKRPDGMHFECAMLK